MNERVKTHLTEYCKKKGFGTDEATLVETVKESKRIEEREIDKCRHWTEYCITVEVDGMCISYIDAATTDDMSASEKGFEFNPDYIREVRPVEKKITTYVPVD